MVTVSCAEGDVGRVYKGALPVKTARVALGELPRPQTAIMLNLGNPELAFKAADLPNDGVGLARMEFIISESHQGAPDGAGQPRQGRRGAGATGDPRAGSRLRPAGGLLRPEACGRHRHDRGGVPSQAGDRAALRLQDQRIRAAAGWRGFEPKEENPMLGFRGAARYAHPAYAAGFALECAALRRVRADMGLTNVRVMVPFCRRVEEARRVLETMAGHGLKRGENGLEVYVMCEIPNNVILIDAFAELFDGFSIGSNDLTQLTLGVDRDSEIVAFDFDERDPGMMEMLKLAVPGAKRNGTPCRHLRRGAGELS